MSDRFFHLYRMITQRAAGRAAPLPDEPSPARDQAPAPPTGVVEATTTEAADDESVLYAAGAVVLVEWHSLSVEAQGLILGQMGRDASDRFIIMLRNHGLVSAPR